VNAALFLMLYSLYALRCNDYGVYKYLTKFLVFINKLTYFEQIKKFFP